MKLIALAKQLCILFFITIFIQSCGDPYKLHEENPEEIQKIAGVQADKTLETVTWNLEWYGSGFSGPSDQQLQTKNILQVIDSLNADLFAFQEVNGNDALNNIVDNMRGFKGFTADYVPRSQKMAIAYNTNTIDSVNAGPIQDVRDAYQNDWKHYWASGRLPLFFNFTYSYAGSSKKFYAIVIHGKANTGDSAQEYQEAYQRRKKAAEGLYHYLQDQKPHANIILLGDYNDDVDRSIYYENDGGYANTPYYQFVADTDHFDVLTKQLSDAGESTSVNYEDNIDHITISNELFDNYVQSSTAIYDLPQSYIEEYGSTTSDHYPVWAKFDVTVN